MRVELKVTGGPLYEASKATGGKSFPFDEPDIFIFGRALDAHCSLPSDLTISRHHFMLEINPPDCTLTDLNSGNGTVVNGVLYRGKERGPAPPGSEVRGPRPVELRSGDRVVAGKTSFVVSIAHGLTCERCGRPLPVLQDGSEETVLASIGGMMLCDECSEKEFARVQGARVAPRVVGGLSCARCGKDATAEAGLRAAVIAKAGAGVDYICAACRARFQTTVGRRPGESRPRGGGPGGGRAVPSEGMGDVPPPPPIEGYHYIRLIGTGGQGAVYLARQAATGREVAIKALLPSVAVMEESAARFMREIETTSSIRHPNVVEIIEHGRAGAVFYFVMEYVEGTDARELTETRGWGLPEDEAVSIALDSLSGLAYAHGLGFVHRDLKPANILLEGRSAPWRAKVADFGLAKNFEMAGLSGLTMEGDIKGTVWFMPKEQITRFRWLGPAADVFSMGATLYFLLTGRPVKRGLETAQDTPSAVRAVTSEPAVPIRERRSDISPGLAKVIDRSLAQEEADRYLDAATMKEALVRAAEG